MIVSSDEDDPPSTKNKTPAKAASSSNKRRIIYSDDEDNNTPSRKKPNLSAPIKSKDQPKLKLVSDLKDVFSDEPIKRVEKPVASNKTMTEEEINEHFIDDLDISAVPDVSDVDVIVNKINEVAKGVKEADDVNGSVIEGTPKVDKQKQRNDKKRSAKKASLDSSKYRAEQMSFFLMSIHSSFSRCS